MTILIVEDNATNAMILKHLAKKATDEDIVAAPDGCAALTLCHQETFSLLVVDQMMPGMTGLEFVNAVRLMDRYRDVPIVMVTADDEPRLRDQAQAAGISDCLKKPLDAVAFRHLVATYLGKDGTSGEFKKTA